MNHGEGGREQHVYSGSEDRGKGRTRCENGLSRLRIIIPDVSMTRVNPINSISGSGNRKSRLSYHPLEVLIVRGGYAITN